MFFSRLKIGSLPPDTPQLWRAQGDAYALHHLVWSLFSDGPDRRRDFLYRHEGDLVYAVSARPPQNAWAGPALAYKPYAPQIEPGMRLYFSLRANPIVSRRDELGRQHRHDVVMEAKHKLRQESGQPLNITQTELVRQTGLRWLETRAPGAGFSFAPDSLRVEGYRQHQFGKRGSSRQVSLSTLDFEGLLTVTEPTRFLEVLFNGLGPAKGFGCGLMLVKGGG